MNYTFCNDKYHRWLRAIQEQVEPVLDGSIHILEVIPTQEERQAHAKVDSSYLLPTTDFETGEVLGHVDLNKTAAYDIAVFKRQISPDYTPEQLGEWKNTLWTIAEAMRIKLQEHVKEHKPDLLVIQTPIGEGRRTIVRLCRANGVRVAAVCVSPFPGFYRIDHDAYAEQGGFLYDSDTWPRIQTIWWEEHEEKRFEQWRETLIAYHQTRGPEEGTPDDGSESQTKIDKFDVVYHDSLGKDLELPSKFVLIVGQMTLDANQYIHQRGIELDPMWAVQKLKAHNIDLPIIYKLHPQEPRDEKKITELERLGVQVVGGGIELHHLISHADRVITWNSNVGIESLLHHKPLMVIGDCYWRNKGLTFDVDSINPNMGGFESFVPDTKLIDQFLKFVVCRFLVREDDTERLVKRLQDLAGGKASYGM